MRQNRSFLIPMIVSMLLLPCFLGYFIYTEYQGEKEAIALEAKDQVINRFFAKIDTFAQNSNEGDSRLVSWVRGDSGTNVSFKLKIAAEAGDRANYSGINHGAFKIEIDSLVSDTVVTIISHKEEGHLPHRFPDLIKNKHVDSAETLELYRLNSKTDGPFFAVSQEEVPMSKVLFRIIPQMLLSLFLFISVLLAYWLVSRTLRKERQLTLLRNDFMSNMSHELKTPVSTIGVALEALSSFDAGDNPRLRKEYIDISKLEVERLGLLVDKALNISLYEQGKFVFDRQFIDLKTETEKIIKTLKVPLDNQNVALNFNAKGSDFSINVDRTHMINVVYNLIENAVKYSNEDAEISVDIAELKHEIEIAVSDKGRGIAPEYQDKVFDKFFRVPQGNKHNVKGHGLGLSYVKEVVESLGGTIKLKSGANVGSTFIIRMPKSNG
jgi:signal transduction histidine kinase